LALRYLRVRALTRLGELNSGLDERLPGNRIARSVLLVAIYAAAFFPLSMLVGSTAQFLLIIPVVIMGTWLGRRDGTFAAVLFIPVLVILIYVSQKESLTYLLHPGRPVAMISLFVMATITGHASDLAPRLDSQLEIADFAAQKLKDNSADRDALLERLSWALSVTDARKYAA
jgi:hypothetical protein